MGPCSFLNSTLKLDPRRHIFSAGQPYTLSLILELPNSFVNQVWRDRDKRILKDLFQDLGMFMTCLSVFDEKQIIITRSCKSSLPEFRWFGIIQHFTQFRACDQVTAAEDNWDPGPQPGDDARPDIREAEAGHPSHGGVLCQLGVPRRLDCHRDTFQAHPDILCEVIREYTPILIACSSLCPKDLRSCQGSSA